MKKIISIICFCFLLFSFFSFNVFASNTNSNLTLNGIFNQGNSFFNPTVDKTGDYGDFEAGINGVINSVYEIIKIIGNFIILICGTILGAKYIWSAASDRADAKGALIPFMWGCIFFYCATGVFDFSKSVLSDSLATGSIEGMGMSIYLTIANLMSYACILAVIVIGLRYMFATPDLKGELKKRFIPMIIGILLVYSTSNIITVIVKAFNDVT